MAKLSFNEITNYATKCIICGKETKLCLSSYYGRNLKLDKKEGFLVSRTRPGTALKDHDVILDPNNGTIIKGHDKIDRVIGRSMTSEISKKCKTCNFRITFDLYKSEEDTKVYYKAIPDFYLSSEYLEFFQKNSKRIVINKFYKTNAAWTWRNVDKISIRLENKIIQDVPFDAIDFNSIKNLKHMNRILSLIKIFR